MIEVKFKGLDKLLKKLEELPKELQKKALANALFDILEDAKKSIRDKFREPKSGKVYRKSPYQTTYIASAPGEPPAIRTGNLDRSLDESRVEIKDKEVHIIAGGDQAPYAVYLEFGTGKMEARPFFYETAEQRKKHWFDIIKTEIEKVLK